jgi:hypothetical protein
MRKIWFLFVFMALAMNAIYAEPVKDGYGTAKLPDSSVYEGNFKNGLFNGHGKLTCRNGTTYEGEYVGATKEEFDKYLKS